MKNLDLINFIVALLSRLSAFIPYESRGLFLLTAAELMESHKIKTDGKPPTEWIFDTFWGAPRPVFDVFTEAAPLPECFEGMWVIINPGHMLPKYRNKRDQLVMATGGFGCHLSKGGKVYVRLLEDIGKDDPTGQLTDTWRTGNILGLASPQQIEEVHAMVYGEAICANPLCTVCK